MDHENVDSAKIACRIFKQTNRYSQLRKACLLNLFEKLAFYTQKYISLNKHEILGYE